MNKILWVLLLFLLLLVGRKRGLKTFITFFISMVLIVIYIIMVAIGLNPIVLAFFICIIASVLSLFFLNGYSNKTKSSFLSVIIVQLIIFALIYIIGSRANIGGFGAESLETIGGYNFSINCNMSNILLGMYLVSIIGTVIDTSISVSSSMNEVYKNNKKITEKELFESGMNVGGDILSTTINTLFFALISVSIGFFMWHRGFTVGEVINYKIFVENVIQLLISFIGSILIIPVTSYISSRMLINKNIKVFLKHLKSIK